MVRPLAFVWVCLVATSSWSWSGCRVAHGLRAPLVDPNEVFVEEASANECAANGTTLCEHDGRCVLDQSGRPTCDCTGTGYTGRTCHFALYKQSCRELYVAGHHKSGSYIIDVDRNGRLPPGRVECAMAENFTQTTILHNAPNEIVVRRRDLNSFYLNITYRDFTNDMLQKLIANSERCYQSVRYECKSAQLKLGAYTWLESSYRPGSAVYSFGGQREGRCACSDTETCVSKEKPCNCDAPLSGEWRMDAGNLTNRKELAITRAFFFKPSKMRSDAEARFKLGPLSCLDSHAQEQVVTFPSEAARVKLAPWREGDLSFSFRTAQSSAVILHQAASVSGSGFFKIILRAPKEIEFVYAVNGKARTTKLIMPTNLGNGDWHKVRVDYDGNHMRFTVDLVDFMVDLDPQERFGHFEGPLYVGAAASSAPDLAEEEGQIPGFRGCIRGLLVNNKAADLLGLPGSEDVNSLKPGCEESCRPQNPCQNGASCRELWGSYECLCANHLAHSGRNCESNANGNAATFTTGSSYLRLLSEKGELRSLLTKDLTLSIRTHSVDALLLYANDHLNNFVQLHIKSGTTLVFTFNNLRDIVSVELDVGAELSSGKVIQVLVQRSTFKTKITANGISKEGHDYMGLLDSYFQQPWTSGEALELVRPARPPLPVQKHTQLFIAGVDGIGATAELGGFIGCIQGLLVSGQQIDLAGEAHRKQSHHILVGCRMLCDAKPCANNGACIENWTLNRTSCNCSQTSYRGETCTTDIGAKFIGLSSVKVSLPEFTTPVKTMEVQLAFSSEQFPPAYGQVIWRVILLAHMNEDHLLISLSSQGSLLVEEQSGGRVYRQTIYNDKINYADGWRHRLEYLRSDEELYLKVDGISHSLMEEKVEHNITETKSEGESELYVGSLDQHDYAFSVNENFVGCISNVLVKIDSLEVAPLDWAFTETTHLARVTAKNVRQGVCAKPKPPSNGQTSSNVVLPPQNIKEWTPLPPSIITFSPAPNYALEDEEAERIRWIVFFSCLGFLLFVFTLVGIYMCRLQRRYKREKFQGETPFFHPKRRKSQGKFKHLNEDQHTVDRLLQFQAKRADSKMMHPDLKIQDALIEEDEETKLNE